MYACSHMHAAHLHTRNTLQEDGDPLAIDPLDLLEGGGGEEVDEEAVQDELDSSMFDAASGMSRNDVKQVRCCLLWVL